MGNRRRLSVKVYNNHRGSKCPITPVCGVTCGENCPAFNLELKPIHCAVMRAAIRAFQAQEDYWMLKIREALKEHRDNYCKRRPGK